mmetsp:Transcript_48809/g.121925  ORF Transcript_48809/g.121925 Transcript_48809/m.121925 type:complete len:214 (+) Transcript_48809:969-1610(+)
MAQVHPLSPILQARAQLAGTFHKPSQGEEPRLFGICEGASQERHVQVWRESKCAKAPYTQSPSRQFAAPASRRPSEVFFGTCRRRHKPDTRHAPCRPCALRVIQLLGLHELSGRINGPGQPRIAQCPLRAAVYNGLGLSKRFAAQHQQSTRRPLRPQFEQKVDRLPVAFAHDQHQAHCQPPVRGITESFVKSCHAFCEWAQASLFRESPSLAS